MSESQPPVFDRPAGGGRVGTIVGVLVLGGLALVAGWLLLRGVDRAAPIPVATNGPRRVRVEPIRVGAGPVELVLPAVARPIEVSSVVARSSGYVSTLMVDLGDVVTKGQVLATITAAEAGAEVRAAQAALNEAQVSERLATATRDRARTLAKDGLVSPQELDLAESTAKRATAAVAVNRAEASRRGTLAGYQQVLAPFAGVITQQLVNVGAMATAGQTPLLQLANADSLDIQFEVPQSMAGAVKAGLEVQIGSLDLGAKLVPGTITRTTGIIDATTRTMRAEVRIPGNVGVVPGSTVDVRVTQVRVQVPVLVSARALAARPDGVSIALVDAEGIASWQTVMVIRDLGRDVELTPVGPVQVGTQVVLSPPLTLVDGEHVQTVLLAPPKAKGGRKP